MREGGVDVERGLRGGGEARWHVEVFPDESEDEVGVETLHRLVRFIQSYPHRPPLRKEGEGREGEGREGRQKRREGKQRRRREWKEGREGGRYGFRGEGAALTKGVEEKGEVRSVQAYSDYS